MTARTLLAVLATLLMTTAGAQAPQPPAATAANAGVPQPPGLPGGTPAPQPTQPAVASAAQPPAAGASAQTQALPEERSRLGRLFFTPTERARLDELRHRPQATRVETAKAVPPPPPPPPRYVTVNGVVRRSDGESTVWLNNKPVPGQQAADGLIASPTRGQPPSHVTVRVPETGRSIDVKVGQQLEVNSGAVQEAFRTSAPAPAANAPRVEAPDARTSMRRNDREREFLRDLVREIEAESAAAAGANRQGAPGAQHSEVRR